MEDENMPNDLKDFYTSYEEPIIENTTNKENEDYWILYNSNGWKKLSEYIDMVKTNITISTKVKEPNESLESYAAKRLASDAICDALDNLINYVKNPAENYIKK